MKIRLLFCMLGLIFFSSCATTTAPRRSTNESMLNFLPYLNQKVAGYIIENKIKSLDANSYKEIVNAMCYPLSPCRKSAENMFRTYTVTPRMLDGMFSVMLCDKDGKTKDMEDFSCNEEKVEIRNYEIDSNAHCEFEANWKEKIKPFCPEFKPAN
jgi:hypothetical protein